MSFSIKYLPSSFLSALSHLLSIVIISFLVTNSLIIFPSLDISHLLSITSLKIHPLHCPPCVCILPHNIFSLPLSPHQYLPPLCPPSRLSQHLLTMNAKQIDATTRVHLVSTLASLRLHYPPLMLHLAAAFESDSSLRLKDYAKVKPRLHRRRRRRQFLLHNCLLC